MSQSSTQTGLLRAHGIAIGVLTVTVDNGLKVLAKAPTDVPILTMLVSAAVFTPLCVLAYTETIKDLERTKAEFRFKPVLAGLALGASFGFAVLGATGAVDRFIIRNERGEETVVPQTENSLGVCMMPIDGPPPPCNPS